MYSAYIRTETETGGNLRFNISRAEGEANIEPQTSDRRGRGPYIHWNTPHIHGSYNIYHDIRFAEPAKTSTLPCYMRFTVRAKTSLAVLLPSLSWFGVSLCTMSKLPRPLKHPRNDFESDSDFEDMPKHKARRVCQPQRFVAVSEADVDASKKLIVVKNTEKQQRGLSESSCRGLKSETSKTRSNVQWKCSAALSLQQSTSIGHCSLFRSSIHDMKTPTAHAVAFSVFFTTMGFLLASTSASETATKRCGWQTLRTLCFGMSSKSESLSKSFRGCFNGLGLRHSADSAYIPPLTQQYTPMGIYARYTTCTMYAIADSVWHIYIIYLYTFFSCALQKSRIDTVTHCIVKWKAEGALSTLPLQHITPSDAEVGDLVQGRWKANFYSAFLVALGTLVCYL